jgi:hypothetical protein
MSGAFATAFVPLIIAMIRHLVSHRTHLGAIMLRVL